MQTSMFFAEERHVNPSPSRDCARDWLTLGATSCSPLALLQRGIAPSGWFGRTSPASCPATADGILEPSSGCWANSGMGSPTEFLTLSTSEHAASPMLSRSADVVCSLSDILETGDVPQRFFLSPTACLGILRRAEKRGKRLPEALQAALSQVAASDTPTKNCSASAEIA